MRYPLDYLFHSADFRLGELRTLEDIGSDHLSLLVELSFELDAEQQQRGPLPDSEDKAVADDAIRAAHTATQN